MEMYRIQKNRSMLFSWGIQTGQDLNWNVRDTAPSVYFQISTIVTILRGSSRPGSGWNITRIHISYHTFGKI